MSGRPKLICFDWDGTLVDSFDRIARCFIQAGEEAGCNKVSPETIKKRIGMPFEQLISEVYGPINMGKFKQAYRKAQDELPDAPLFPEVKPLLSFLKPTFFIAIVSNQSRHQLDKEIKTHRLTSYIDSTWVAEDYAAKPSPVMLQHAASAHQVSPQEAWFVGDALADFYAAHSAHFGKILLLRGLPIPSWAENTEVINGLQGIYTHLNVVPCE